MNKEQDNNLNEEKYDILRDSFLDLAKYICIFMVIWGHIVQQSCMLDNPYTDYVYRAIYTFHMPVFMGICGYFFYKTLIKVKDTKIYVTCKLKKRLVSLAVPMLSFGILKMIFTNEYGLIIWLKLSHDIWFLGNLAMNTMIIALLCSVFNVDVSNIKWPLMIIGLPFVSIPKLGYGSQGFFMYLSFVYGMYISSCKDLKRYNSRCMFLRAITLFSLTWWLVEYSCYEAKGFNINIFRYPIDELLVIDVTTIILGVTGSYIFFFLLYKLYYLIKDTRLVKRAVTLGRYTLDVYLLNIIVLEIVWGSYYRDLVIRFGINFFHNFGLLAELCLTFIMSCFMFEFLILVSRIMNSNKIIAKLFFYR